MGSLVRRAVLRVFSSQSKKLVFLILFGLVLLTLHLRSSIDIQVANTSKATESEAEAEGDILSSKILQSPLFRNVSVYRNCLHEHLLPWVGKKSQTKVLDGLVDHIYVVTTYEGERRELMKRRLGKILPKGWEELNVVSFISIGDLSRLTAGMWHCFQSENRCQFVGAIAISMSNYAAHYSSVYHGYDRILVLEDDVNFKEGFVEHMARQVRLIEKEPYRKYIRADPGHLERPEKLDYFTPEHLWDQVMLR